MTKDQIIATSLQAVNGEQGLLAAREAGGGSTDEYDDIVIATLAERLPEGDITTCGEFQQLGIGCCNTCHTCYPHYDMYLEDRLDGHKTWICCTVRSELRKSQRVVQFDEALDSKGDPAGNS